MTDSEAIRDLIARYNYFGDSGRFDQLLELFADDATMTVDGTAYDDPAAIRGLFQTAAGPRPVHVRHFTSTHVIDLDGDTASARCYFQVLTAQGLDHWGRYRDRFVRSGARWLFVHRDVRVDGVTPGGWADRRLQPRHDAP